MLDVPLVRTVLAVVVIVVFIWMTRRALENQNRQLQAHVLFELHELIKIKRMEVEAHDEAHGCSATATTQDPGHAPDEIQAAIDAVVDDISHGPYVHHHIRPDLPPGVGTLRWDTPDGPVVVTGSARARRSDRRRARGGTLLGLLTIPGALVGMLWRSATTTATTASAPTASMAAAATAVAAITLGPIALAPAHTPADRDRPAAVVDDEQRAPVGIMPSNRRAAATDKDEDQDKEESERREDVIPSSAPMLPPSPTTAPTPAPSPRTSPAPSTTPAPTPTPSSPPEASKETTTPTPSPAPEQSPDPQPHINPPGPGEAERGTENGAASSSHTARVHWVRPYGWFGILAH